MKALKDGKFLRFIKDAENELTYDLSNGGYNKKTNGKWRKVLSPNPFFAGNSEKTTNEIMWDCIKNIEDEKFKKIFLMTIKNYKRIQNAGTMLDRIREFMYLEEFIISGWNISDSYNLPSKKATDAPKDIKRLVSEMCSLDQSFNNFRHIEWGENLYSCLRLMDKTKKRITNMRFILDYFHGYTEVFLFLVRKNTIKTWVNWAGEERSCVNGLNLEIKNLMQYILYLREKEGFSMYNAVMTLKDTLLMQIQSMVPENPTEADVFKAKSKICIYPKNLMTIHKIVESNKSDISMDKEKSLKRMIKDYSGKFGEYRFIMPKSSNDIIEDSRSLSHCGHSYIDNIIYGESQIVFMRKSETESLVTIELCGNVVNHARGYFNRALDEKELNALSKWAAKNGFTINKEL